MKFDQSNTLYDRALKTIPLASQTFSKSAMMYVRGATPLFIERGDGARVWDPDGNSFIDCVLGLLPVVLGYRDQEVDEAIRQQLERGIIFSLPSTLEMELAERLVALIPCAEMVRLGKNGSDATTAAIRLARAHTGRNRVAVAGYHGWHDWYIGTTARHLGVPDAVRELSSTIPFNDADALEDLLKSDPDGFAAVMLEPAGVVEPLPGYLERVRELTEKYGVVLVFDEIVTGFRIDLGGAQKKYGVTPDLATFGKAMANGMPISAVVGRKALMQRMDDIFFSGTFGGETLSIAAALATLNKLEALNAPAIFEKTGNQVISQVTALIQKTGLTEVIKMAGVSWWPRLEIKKHERASQLEVVSLLRQEFIANGLLAGGGFNLSLAHADEKIVSEMSSGVEKALQALSDHLSSSNPASRLRGEMVQPVFQVRK